ncbi:conjugal transfer TraD family protein, partial [Salmonella enterica]|nr:conjugal transfer TraD family protein [Salmonella enterica]
MKKEDNVFMKNKEGKKLRTEKTLEQKIASAQMRLNRL